MLFICFRRPPFAAIRSPPTNERNFSSMEGRMALTYTLIGCAPGERCVIERTEKGFETREKETSAANDWVPSRPMWERVLGPLTF